MKTLFLLSSCVLFLTGCMVTPSDDYYRSTGYYSNPVYYNYSSSYRNYHTVNPVRQNRHLGHYARPPKHNQNLNKPHKPEFGKEQHRPLAPKPGAGTQHRPIRPENGQQRPSRPQQGQGRPQVTQKPKDQKIYKRPIKNNISSSRSYDERKAQQLRS